MWKLPASFRSTCHLQKLGFTDSHSALVTLASYYKLPPLLIPGQVDGMNQVPGMSLTARVMLPTGTRPEALAPGPLPTLVSPPNTRSAAARGRLPLGFRTNATESVFPISLLSLAISRIADIFTPESRCFCFRSYRQG